MDINISKKDIIWNYIGTAFAMGINYLMLPLFLLFFDDDTLGIWYIFMNIATIANLFTFGFSQSFARNIAYCWGGVKELSGKGKISSIRQENSDKAIDEDLLYSILGTCKRIYMRIALIAIVFLISIGSIYIFVILSLSKLDVLIAWGVFLSAVFMNLYFGYCEAFLNGVGAIEKKNKAQVLSNIIRIVLTAALLWMGIGLVGACLAYLLYGLSFRVIGLHFFQSETKNKLKRAGSTLVNKKERYESEVLKRIWPNTWRTGVVLVASYLTSYAGTILISFFLPLSVVGNYSLSVQLVMAVERIAYSYTGSLHPTLQVNYIKDEWDKLRRNSIKCILIFVILYLLGIMMILFLGEPVLRIFRKGFQLNRWMIAGIAISEFTIGFRNEFTAILSTMNNVECWKAFIISGVVSVALGGLLMNTGIGIAGVLVATIVTELAYNFWHWPKVYLKEVNH